MPTEGRSARWILIGLVAAGVLTTSSGCRSTPREEAHATPPEDPALLWERTTEPLAEADDPVGEASQPITRPEEQSPVAAAYPADNTGINHRDRQAGARTPMDQGRDRQAVNITTQIRKRVIAADLSFTAKNIKIISAEGIVTLKGPVASAAEREQILAIAQRVSGDWRIEDLMAVIEDERG